MSRCRCLNYRTASAIHCCLSRFSKTCSQMLSNSPAEKRMRLSKLASGGRKERTSISSETTVLVLTCSTQKSCSACFSGCIPRKSLKARVLVSPSSDALFNAMAVVSGRKPGWIVARHFISPLVEQFNMIDVVANILLVEDSADDAAFVSHALEEAQLGANLHIARDGSEAL